MKHIIFNILTGFTLGEIVFYENRFWKIVHYERKKLFNNKKVYLITIVNNNGYEIVSEKVLQKVDSNLFNSNYLDIRKDFEKFILNFYVK